MTSTRPCSTRWATSAAYIGPIGTATVAKLVHNMSGYAITCALAETFTMGVKAGMDPVALWEAVRQGVGGRRLTFDGLLDQFLPGKYDPPNFALKLATKDVKLATELGRELGVPMRMCNLAYAEMREACNRGWEGRDSRVVMLLEQERAGVKIAADPEQREAGGGTREVRLMLAPDGKPPMLLQQPGRIGPLSLKNRVVMGPMGTNFGTTDGFSTERDKIYYAERARGGAAMIITEAMVVSGKARNHRASLCIFDDRFIPGLADLTKAIHQAGALVCGQLNHRGMLLRRSVLGMEPVGPSPGKNPATGDEVRALSRHDIAEIQQQFLSSAVRLYRAGYDAVELHAANGYLFQQFFTPRHNQPRGRIRRLGRKPHAAVDGNGAADPFRAARLPDDGAAVGDRICRWRLFGRRYRGAVEGAGSRGRRRDRSVGRHQRDAGIVALLHPAAVVSAALSGALCAADQGCRDCAGDHGRPDADAGGC